MIEVVTVGFPFCAFKVLSGVAFRSPAGWALIALGCIDALLNLVTLLRRGRPILGVCATHAIARGMSPRYSDVGLATDVFLSFSLVALMIALGGIAKLSPAALQAWNVAVILNVIGAGYGRLSSSLREVK